MKKFFALLFAVCISALALSACGASGPSSGNDAASNFSIEEYRSAISENRTAIYDATVYLASVGEFEYNKCKALEQLGSSGIPNQAAVESAFEWLAKNSDGTRESVDAAHEAIRQQYKSIILIEPEGTEAEMLHESYSAMYDAYADLYSLVTNPSCSLSDFLETYNKCIDIIKECDEDLSLFLD